MLYSHRRKKNDYSNLNLYTGDSGFNGLANLTYVSGTQPFGPGSQMCVDISINNDQLVEQTETFVVCGCPTPLAVIPEANGCVNVAIFDNDGKIQYPRRLIPGLPMLFYIEKRW